MDKISKEKEADNLISRYIFQSRKFIWYACFAYGAKHYAISGEKNTRFTYDFEYFAFTKSTKSLISIRMLLKAHQNEDVFILLRSILENYMSCRYFTEHDELIDNFIFYPIFLDKRLYFYDAEIKKIKDREGKEIPFESLEPASLKLGSDKKYFYELYDFLCKYTHCNFCTLECYIDEQGEYSCDQDKNSLIVRVLTVFIFSKLFEQVVTVEGEDFLDTRTERACYNLLKDSLLFLNGTLDELSISGSYTNEYLKKYMKQMFKEMKKSLKEEIGSVNKDFLK